MLAIVTSITFSVATIFVILRFISRLSIAHHVASDDWLIVVAWAVALGLNILCWVALSEGFGSARAIGDNVEQLTGELFGFSMLYVGASSLFDHIRC